MPTRKPPSCSIDLRPTKKATTRHVKSLKGLETDRTALPPDAQKALKALEAALNVLRTKFVSSRSKSKAGPRSMHRTFVATERRRAK